MGTSNFLLNNWIFKKTMKVCLTNHTHLKKIWWSYRGLWKRINLRIKACAEFAFQNINLKPIHLSVHADAQEVLSLFISFALEHGFHAKNTSKQPLVSYLTAGKPFIVNYAKVNTLIGQNRTIKLIGFLKSLSLSQII